MKKLLYSFRNLKDQNFIINVCKTILSLQIYEKPNDDSFCAIMVEGRLRKLDTLEYLTSIWSFKTFSKFNYPVFVFCNTNIDCLGGDWTWIKENRIELIQIEPLNSLEEYTKFCIEKLYYLIPTHIDNIITIQPDGMLLKEGFEDWIINNEFDLIGSHWSHKTSLTSNGYHFPYPMVQGCNLGFSFRKAAKMREISNIFKEMKNLRQFGDTNCPEDVFYSYLGYGSKICKLPTLKECDVWAKDPLTIDIWNDKKNLPFGFHCFRAYPEFPVCNHN